MTKELSEEDMEAISSFTPSIELRWMHRDDGTQERLSLEVRHKVLERDEDVLYTPWEEVEAFTVMDEITFTAEKTH